MVGRSPPLSIDRGRIRAMVEQELAAVPDPSARHDHQSGLSAFGQAQQIFALGKTNPDRLHAASTEGESQQR